ncbi:hypothetical protein [Flavobacterium sp. Arc2]|uniref:hypothetical protein n=1 Tax=Flavobacterium sp. Arc2 TaxID=3046685 RepID=UPI00352DDED3
MKIVSKDRNIEKVLVILYFLTGIIEILFQIYMDSYFQYIIKPVEFLLLITLYWYTSSLKNGIYFFNLLFVLIARMFFISNEITMIGYALIFVFFHRVIEIYYVAKLTRINDYIPALLASIPFLFYFLYFVSIPDNVMVKSYINLVIQIILISALSGIVLSNYLLADDKKDIWLLIFGIMSISLTFVVLIERFYLSDVTLISLRPLALFLNTLVCFSFYKFVIINERLNND